jgi:hypothetical protein
MDSDDVAAGITTYLYDAAGNLMQMRHLAAGPDAVLNTGDDVISSLYATTYDASQRRTEQTVATSAGVDTQWGTADDVLNSITTYTYGPNGMTRELRYCRSRQRLAEC